MASTISSTANTTKFKKKTYFWYFMTHPDTWKMKVLSYQTETASSTSGLLEWLLLLIQCTVHSKVKSCEQSYVYAILECEKQRVLNISETTCYKLTVRMYWQHLIHHVRSATQGMAVNHLITRIHTVILFYLTATVSHFPLTHFTHETPMCNNVLAEYDAYQQVDENN